MPKRAELDEATVCDRACGRASIGSRNVRQMRVALFTTCLIDALFPDAGRATVRLLERLGQPLEFPLEQTCCGQMHANSGYLEPELVRRYAKTFAEYDAVVVPSGSCAGSIRHQHPMIARLSGDETLAAQAEAIAAKTYELSEFLIDALDIDDVGAYFPHRVTYHPTCHSLRVLEVGDAPLRLLRAVRDRAGRAAGREECCGFGGHIRRQERRYLSGDARGQDRPRSSTRGPRSARRRTVRA